jgi:hypothetical protein
MYRLRRINLLIFRSKTFFLSRTQVNIYANQKIGIDPKEKKIDHERKKDVPNLVSRLSTLQGLTSNDVRQVLQDSEGYVWIATSERLCRFDGYRIKTCKSGLYSPNLLSNNFSTKI